MSQLGTFSAFLIHMFVALFQVMRGIAYRLAFTSAAAVILLLIYIQTNPIVEIAQRQFSSVTTSGDVSTAAVHLPKGFVVPDESKKYVHVGRNDLPFYTSDRFLSLLRPAGYLKKNDFFQVLGVKKDKTTDVLIVQINGVPAILRRGSAQREALQYCGDRECSSAVAEVVKTLTTLNQPHCDKCAVEKDQGVKNTAARVAVPQVHEIATVKPVVAGQCVPRFDKTAPLPDFSKIPQGAARDAVFFNFFAPLAMEIQEKTSLPASVILGQAAKESNRGTSNGAKAYNNFFGHSCTARSRYYVKGQAPTEYNWNLVSKVDGSSEFAYRSICGPNRPASEGGHYFMYPSFYDSFMAHADILSPADQSSRSYKTIREELAKVRPPQAASWTRVVDGLRGYAVHSKYRPELKELISESKLFKYDEMRLCN